MATSPYTDPILDYLADGQPHTIAEIRVAIMAPDGAGIDQLLRGMMWELAVKRDPRKLTSEKIGHQRIYRIVSRDPSNPFIPETREEIIQIPLAPVELETQETVAGRAYRHEKDTLERKHHSPICRSDPGRPDGWNGAFLHSMNGWLKLHRKIREWEWYSCPSTKSVFLHCILSANWKERQWSGIRIPRGSFFTSDDSLSRELGLSRQQIRTALSRLKSTNEITIESTKRGKLITLCNFEAYNREDEDSNQVNNQRSNHQLTNEQPTSNQRATITEEGKEYKKEKKERSGEAASKARPQTREEFNSYFREIGLYPRDAEATWNKWEGNGWTNGGKKIVCWKSTVRSWKASSFMPSQKSPSDYEREWPSATPAQAEPEEDDLMASFLRHKEAEIREAAGDHPDYWPEDETAQREEAECF